MSFLSNSNSPSFIGFILTGFSDIKDSMPKYGTQGYTPASGSICNFPANSQYPNGNSGQMIFINSNGGVKYVYLTIAIYSQLDINITYSYLVTDITQ